MKIIQILWIIALGAGLWACSSASVFVQTDKVGVNTSIHPDDTLQTLIAPYKKALAADMDRVIGFASDDLVRARPEGPLGNFVIDETEDYLKQNNVLPVDNFITLMNHGSLRSPISYGDITVGDVFKLMPFDNTIVLAKLPMTAFDSIVKYLINSGGEPIGGFQLTKEDVAFDEGTTFNDTLYVVTTDYLANGGDNMNFFKQRYEVIDTGILLRNILLQQVEKKKNFHPVLDNRIML
ncbi:5'-nucleotidase C-terminal domain-containing protein [Brumimicrobium aurantiacum]|uniref:5'-Nucleotidase C-terminal domain-containing protein n=1 Tax=Brumimicrobium aurantiacum TaxID=1737063 RepID=A0A3E1EZL0_9FLAO|nr:5'-nucleotidase C-terminal domain-containing protein [Brumimicrobium aurantiacum]RFC55001.1 hypothetical protein DXU93_04040 [Brumimicrobium aurantiacum]